MSSTYRILCLSHDPATTLEEEFHSGNDGLQRAESAVAAGLTYHPDCDLLIGRYSYPLVEVGCPHPRGTKWIDASWLKLLYLAQCSEDNRTKLLAEKEPIFRCWKPERLHRLRYELGMENSE